MPPLFTLLPMLMISITSSMILPFCLIIFGVELFSHMLIGTGAEPVFFTMADLPVINGKIDVESISKRLVEVVCCQSPYLLCCTFQKNFAMRLGGGVPGTFVPNPQLPLVMKSLLQWETVIMLSLDNWCHLLGLLPLNVPERETVFQHMLV